MGVINPYMNVDWDVFQTVISVSHAHCETQSEYDLLYAGGVRHMALSNYYPSVPWYPLSDHFEIDADALGSPNAEHHDMTDSEWAHCNGLGSLYESGNPKGETPVGVGASWRLAFAQIIRSLQYVDGGGITINHPNWSKLSIGKVKEFLDFDSERVLGIEIYNDTSEEDKQTGWALDMWDAILKTGRRCWGFAVPDHNGRTAGGWIGRNCLLVSSKTERDCLRAYRSGAFYAKLGTSYLAFTGISLSGQSLTVKTNGATSINVIIDGISTSHSGSQCTVTIPTGATYVRVEGVTANDTIYSNPIVFKPYTPPRKNRATEIALYIS